VSAQSQAARLGELEAENARLRDALQEAVATIEDYLSYTHDGDPWREDARTMGEMDINDYQTDGRSDRARTALATQERAP
jgi:hypothetical protein